MVKRRIVKVLLVLALLMVTFLLLGPIVSAPYGVLGGPGVIRSQWGILSYLTVTSYVQMFGAGDLVERREFEWHAGRLVMTVTILTIVWMTAIQMLRPRSRVT